MCSKAFQATNIYAMPKRSDMAQGIDVKAIERKAWTSYFEDGLWDIFLGAMTLIGVIRSVTDNVWYTLLVAPLILVLPLGKKLITIPRLGHVRFGPARKRQLDKLTAGLIVSVLAVFALLLLIYSGLSLPSTPTSPIMAVWIAVFFGVLAHYLDFGRLYAYGLLYGVSEVLWGQFGKSIGVITQTISGIAILFVGLVVLARFLQRYSIPAEASLGAKE